MIYYVGDPTFSEFRAGEPAAMRAAETVLSTITHIHEGMIVKIVSDYNGSPMDFEVRPKPKEGKVEVYMATSLEPFVFDLVI